MPGLRNDVAAANGQPMLQSGFRTQIERRVENLPDITANTGPPEADRCDRSPEWIGPRLNRYLSDAIRCSREPLH